MRRLDVVTLILLLYLAVAATSAASLFYRPYHPMQVSKEAKLINRLHSLKNTRLHLKNQIASFYSTSKITVVVKAPF